MNQTSTVAQGAPGSVSSWASGLAAWAVARSTRRDLLILSSLLALAVALQGRQIFLGGTFDNRDILLQSIPVYSWYADNLRQGLVPIWSPAILGGFPLAFAQYGFFYPPDMLLFWLLDSARAFHLSLALHLALAGWATYWYCRVLGLRRLPSFFAALAFQMGNEPLAWPANGFITKTLFVLPALLASVELMYRRSSRYWLLIPPAVGAGLLVGYTQFVFIGLLVAGAYLLVLAVANYRSLTVRQSVGRVALFGAGALLGAGLAAVRVLPTMEVADLSVRAAGLSFEQSTVESIHPMGYLLGSLLPTVYDLPLGFGGRPDYIGAPALLLALLALAALRSLGHAGWFHAGLASVAGVLALGSHTPLYGLVLQLPFFSYFRVPGRFSIVAALALSVLAAVALDRYLAHSLASQRLRYRMVAASAVVGTVAVLIGLLLSLSFQFGRDPLSNDLRSVLVEGQWDLLNLLRPRVALPLLSMAVTPWLIVAAARNRISSRVLEFALLGVGATTLFTLGWVQNPWLPASSLNQPPAFLDILQKDKELFRTFSWSPGGSTYNSTLYFAEIFGQVPQAHFEGRYSREFLPPNTGMPYGLQAADGYEALQSRRQGLLAVYTGSERQDSVRFSDGASIGSATGKRSLHDRLDLLSALNVRYLTVSYQIENPRLEHVAEVAVQVYSDAEASATVHLYRLRDSLPRTFVVPESLETTGEARTLEALSLGSVDLRKSVILEDSAPVLAGPRLTIDGSGVEVEHYGNEQVVIRARTDGGGFLVLMDFMLPGWSATVDGQPTSVLTANFGGRAVALPSAGHHEVVFSYEAPLFREGLLTSMISVVLLASAGMFHFARRRPL